MDDHQTSTESSGIVGNGVGYDPSEINAPGVTLFTLVLVGMLLSVFFGVTLYFEKFYTELTRERVDDAPTSDIDGIHAREASELSSYQILDKSKGVVRIPIDQAMKALLVEVPAGKAYSTKDQIVKVEPAAGAPVAPGTAAPAAGAPATAPATAPAKPAAAAPAHK
jgi:hypothetical protein